MVPRCPVAGAGAFARRVRAGTAAASAGQGAGCRMAAPVPGRRRQRSARRPLGRRALGSCGAAVRRAVTFQEAVKVGSFLSVSSYVVQQIRL